MEYNLNREAKSIIRTLTSLTKQTGAVNYKNESFEAQKISFLGSFIWSPSTEPLKEGLKSLKTKIITYINATATSFSLRASSYPSCFFV